MCDAEAGFETMRSYRACVEPYSGSFPDSDFHGFVAGSLKLRVLGGQLLLELLQRHVGTRMRLPWYGLLVAFGCTGELRNTRPLSPRRRDNSIIGRGELDVRVLLAAMLRAHGGLGLALRQTDEALEASVE